MKSAVQNSEYVELDDEAGARIARRLLLHAREQDFFSYALLSRGEWGAVLEARGPAQGEVEQSGNSLGNSTDERDLVSSGRVQPRTAFESLRFRYKLGAEGAMFVVALRYAPDVEPEPEAARSTWGVPHLPAPIPGKPEAKVGRFARGNWYRELLDRLAICAAKTAEDMAGEGLPRFPANNWHRFANSRFPEKALAVAAGLGTIGRNSLLIAERTHPDPHCSSAVVLGLMLLPFDVTQEALGPRRPPRPSLELCASCRRCVDACPTVALLAASTPAFVRDRCIQHYTSIDGALPDFIEAAWSNQLYGCDICLEACPHFVPDPGARVQKGRIGGDFDASTLASMDESELRMALKGSALAQGWISAAALRRNAMIAARARS